MLSRYVLLLYSLAWVGLVVGQQDYGLCSQVYSMHQYCTNQGPAVRFEMPQSGPLAEVRIGKAGPPGRPGPPSTVNYTAIDEKIAKKFKAKEREIIEHMTDFGKKLNKTMDAVFRTKASAGLSTSYPVDCKSVLRKDAKIRQSRGGVFDIYPESRSNSVEVYCDLETDGGGWTVMQRRMDGSVDFYRDWEEYAAGFGQKDKEMWLGLETIYQLTKSGGYELKVELTDWQGNMVYAKYGQFSISSRSDNYRLSVGQYSGNAGDALSLSNHNGRQFSAFDADHDTSSRENCAERWRAGGWFGSCHNTNLNGIYYNGPALETNSVNWDRWRLNRASLQIVEMKFRKK